MQLLDCPGADVAYEIRNIYDMTPLEIADANGFAELATMLRGYIVSRTLYLITHIAKNLNIQKLFTTL